MIREVAPEIVLTHSPVDYMEDHTNTCRLAVTAAFSRGMPNFATDPPRPAVNDPVTVYHAQPYSHRDPLGNVIEPALVVDTTDLIDLKKKMLSKHVSQKEWLDESQGVNSLSRHHGGARRRGRPDVVASSNTRKAGGGICTSASAVPRTTRCGRPSKSASSSPPPRFEGSGFNSPPPLLWW